MENTRVLFLFLSCIMYDETSERALKRLITIVKILVKVWFFICAGNFQV